MKYKNSYTYKINDPGKYEVYVKAMDKAGNESELKWNFEIQKAETIKGIENSSAYGGLFGSVLFMSAAVIAGYRIYRLRYNKRRESNEIVKE